MAAVKDYPTRVLVDSSVWIDFLRSGHSVESKLLNELLQNDRVCLFDIIRAELLSGTRNEPEYRMLEDRLAVLPWLEIPHGFWSQVAQARFRLARVGFQASIPDVSIAVIARHYGCLLFTLDRPLIQAAKILRIKLYSAEETVHEALKFLQTSWRLSGSNLAKLLHLPVNTMNLWLSKKHVPMGTPPFDPHQEGLLALLSIHRSLHTMFSEPVNQLAWLKTEHPELGFVPLEKIQESLSGLFLVQQYLDDARGRGA